MISYKQPNIVNIFSLADKFLHTKYSKGNNNTNTVTKKNNS